MSAIKKYVFDLDDTLYPPVDMPSPWMQSGFFGQSADWIVQPGFYECIQHDPELVALLQGLGQTYIFTNASRDHMMHCLRRMDCVNVFTNGISREVYKGEYKPQRYPYMVAHYTFGLAGSTVFFFEDSLPNLNTAKKLGWNTIFIDHRRVLTRETKPPYVDAVFPDIKSAIRAVGKI